MKVSRITLYSVPVHVDMSLTRYVADQSLHPSLEALVVRMDTDAGLTGWGEACSAPPFYLPELALGGRGGILHVAPLILGQDPRQLRALYHKIETALRGHGNAKTALDMSLWDLCAKAVERPLCDLWGGRVSPSVPVFAVVPIGTRTETARRYADYRAQGYSRFQIKLAAGAIEDDIATIREVMAIALPHERVWFDPNRAWLVDDAIRVILAVRDLSPMIENPCESYEECRVVAKRTGVPFMLDESMDSTRRFVEAVMDGVMDVASLKLNTFGGLSKLRFLCDLGVELGVPMRIENYGGTGILLAAVTHLAQTLPERNIFGLFDYVASGQALVRNPLKVANGRVSLAASPGPGLGVDIEETALGDPVAVLSS
jgi:cis-L-3-hydroxyproline dehydratase